MTISNLSDVDAKLSKVGIVNLSGRQITIGLPKMNEDISLPGKSNSVVSVEIIAHENLVSDRINFGVYIESGDFKSTLRKKLSIASVPYGEAK